MIPFAIPEEFIGAVSSGKLIRYGTVLKDANTGQIVGHLKEVGNLSQILSKVIPSNPLEIGESIASNIQLGQIQKTLESLQLISTVGTIASVASLGVSVVGFSVVINKLNKIDEKLNVIVEQNKRIQAHIEKINAEMQMLNFAKIKTASEQLQNAQISNDPIRRKDLLTQANQTFHIYKNYYHRLAQNLWKSNNLHLEEAYALYNRYIFCVKGELYSEFLLGDLTSFYESWKRNVDEVKIVSSFNSKEIFRTKTDNKMSAVATLDYEQLIRKIKNAQTITTETFQRIETMNIEANYIERKGIEPIEYIQYLKKQKDNLVLIKA